jgi:putative heme-binding domain-containing protein
VLKIAKPQDDIEPMLAAILGRQDGAEKLAQALADDPPTADAAKLTLRHMYALGRSDQALSDVLSKAAGIALDAPPPSQEEVAKIAADVATKGDAARGEQIFRRADLSCMKCHAVSQAGGSVGPELSAIGSISPVDYVVNSILNPNLAIKEQFVTRRVLTVDGEVLTGIQIDRDEMIAEKDAAGKLVIAASDIDQEGRAIAYAARPDEISAARVLTGPVRVGVGAGALRSAKTPGIQRRPCSKPAARNRREVPNVEIFREHVLTPPLSLDHCLRQSRRQPAVGRACTRGPRGPLVARHDRSQPGRADRHRSLLHRNGSTLDRCRAVR